MSTQPADSLPATEPPLTEAPAATPSGPSLGALVDALVFVCRFFGSPVQHEVLLASATALQGQALPQATAELLARAALVGTPIEGGPGVKPTLLPALVVGSQGEALVIIKRQGDQFECHRPGIEGSTWLSFEGILDACAHPSWMAVRPTLHLDQRSLLYTLPQTRQWFWDVFNRNRWILGWALLGTVATNLFAAILPFFSTAVYDRVIPNNALNSLWVLGLAAFVVIGFDLAMRLVRSYLVESAARRMDVALSAKVFAHALRLRTASRPASGGTLANVVKDFESVREFFASSTLTVLGDLPFVLLFLVLITLIGGWLVLVPLMTIPILLGLALLSRKALAKSVSQNMKQSADRTAHLFETMNGLDTVKALGAEAWSRRKWESLTLAISDNTMHTREIVARSNYASASVLSLENVALVIVGAILIGKQEISMGQLIAVTMLASRAVAPISQIASLIVRWEQTRLSFQAVNQIMNSPTDDSQSSLSAPPLKGGIEFRDVNFAYPNSPALLDKLNLKIKPGERVGVIGKLGSGKTTLLRLILNQYGPQSGSVLVDDLVNTQLEPLSLRRQLGYVPQDVTLFHGTVRENIELGRTQASDQALLEAVRIACLDDVITQLPAGIASQVGERGDRLSGGQRQAVAIARALVNKPPVLLLDEPSSMMDPGTEQRLIHNLRGLKDTTILLVTHRMAMLPLVDRLVVMDKGRVVADGPRDAVLKALAGAGNAPPAAQVSNSAQASLSRPGGAA
jgi:ATP-binding cassette subfamily C protein LapB